MQFEILVWLLVKHFICDFPLQAHPWLYSRKGEYGALGGWVHAGIHGVGTAVVLAAIGIPSIGALSVAGTVIVWALFDTAVHYHIDWAKMASNRRLKLAPNNSEWFWILLGADQLAHHLTYAAIAFAVVF